MLTLGSGLGLIPACAGKTQTVARRGRNDGAHPRMRGENIATLPLPAPLLGSSPHARGKRCRTPGLQVPTGLIPACAGKTLRSEPFHRFHRAHPRMRGENLFIVALSLRLSGSSPHARGKRACSPGSRDRLGLIPACAGKTPRHCTTSIPASAHPRMRGENWLARYCSNHNNGSSPHARGKRAMEQQNFATLGLIPACAGKTSNPLAPNRFCGGSSPHARGKRFSGCLIRCSLGLIPACAGKTPRVKCLFINRTAHPRMRGENSSLALEHARPYGSSPHARGKRSAHVVAVPDVGLIPACAG